jgi:hypothetical protein
MGTAEILIVFSALMALIALVTIGIDWIGKPLKHRRFIPRMYRFEDEKLPVDAYGNTDFAPSLGAAPSPTAVSGPPFSPPMAAGPPYAPPLAAAPMAPVPQIEARSSVPRNQPPPRQVARLDPSVRSNSAFSDSLQGTPDAPTPDENAFANAAGHGVIAGTQDAGQAQPAVRWAPGHDLDMLSDGRKPTLAIKAERFWKTVGAETVDSHFTEDDRARMRSGKAPRRTNPRTNRVEAMQLNGLRRASAAADVEMNWPDEAIDPWATS